MTTAEYTPSQRFHADAMRSALSASADLAAHWTAHSFLVRPGTHRVRKSVRLVGHDVLAARHLETRKQEAARFLRSRRSK